MLFKKKGARESEKECVRVRERKRDGERKGERERGKKRKKEEKERKREKEKRKAHKSRPRRRQPVSTLRPPQQQRVPVEVVLYAGILLGDHVDVPLHADDLGVLPASGPRPEDQDVPRRVLPQLEPRLSSSPLPLLDERPEPADDGLFPLGRARQGREGEEVLPEERRVEAGDRGGGGGRRGRSGVGGAERHRPDGRGRRGNL